MGRVGAVLLALFAAGSVSAGESTPAMVWTGSAPSGACAGSRVALVVPTGKPYCCVSGSWVACGVLVPTCSASERLTANGTSLTCSTLPASAVKAWGTVTLGTSPSATVTSGSGVASASWSSSNLTVNLATPMGGTGYVVLPIMGPSALVRIIGFEVVSASQFTLLRKGTDFAAATWNSGEVVSFIVVGD